MKKFAARFIPGILAAAMLALLALPAYAGGWATVGITEMPQEIQAGTPFTIEFMVWQHGNKPVHELVWDKNRTYPVTPIVSFGSSEAGEKLTFEAYPADKQGLFRAEITLPSEGEYTWAISPDPLAGVTELDPLFVSPPAALSPTANSQLGAFTISPGSAHLAALAAGALFLLGLLFLARRAGIKMQ